MRPCLSARINSFQTRLAPLLYLHHLLFSGITTALHKRKLCQAQRPALQHLKLASGKALPTLLGFSQTVSHGGVLLHVRRSLSAMSSRMSVFLTVVVLLFRYSGSFRSECKPGRLLWTLVLSGSFRYSCFAVQKKAWHNAHHGIKAAI